MTQIITDYEMILVKIIHDRWKREIEEAIDRVKYGEAFCEERRRLNFLWRQRWHKSEAQRKARIGPIVQDDYGVERYSHARI